MSAPIFPDFIAYDPDALRKAAGRIVVFADPDEALDRAARRIDTATRGSVQRLVSGPEFGRCKVGEGLVLAYPAGLAAASVQVVRLARRAKADMVRRAGATIGAALRQAGPAVLVLMDKRAHAPELALGLSLRAYAFDAHKTAKPVPLPEVSVMVADPAAATEAAAAHRARAEGVCWTRDLVNEPANILTTDDFTERLRALADLGLRIEVLEEEDLRALGMGALLGVGQGSDAPSRVVVMEWRGPGAPEGPPLALVGKGVVFDTGGVSIKPAGGMEEMTMDMGGAGVVAGVMRTLARRGAAAHVVGLVGLVENMVSGSAQRPGDVARSLKGDTIEVINTDAEGRLVLADVMWYAQERFRPVAMIDLATLTGAVIVALGHGHAGLFSNDDALCDAVARAALAEGEDTWRLPLGADFDKALKSRIADMKNVGGRQGGASIAAQFLQRFVKPGVPWVHIDIAGVALRNEDTPFAPKGATGWGVLALDRLVRDRFEG